MEAEKKLTIIHFNDVYDISEDDNEICGGVARFAAAMKNQKEVDPNAVILFSGDLWSPSRREFKNFPQNSFLNSFQEFF